MSVHSQVVQYNVVARLLHWIVVALVGLQFLLAELAEGAEASRQLAAQLSLLANHKSVGISILVLVMLRLLWRLSVPRPSLSVLAGEMPNWQQQVAHITHYLFYFLLLALPVTGWLGSSASAYGVSWFGLLELPDLVAPDPALKKQLYVAHELLWTAMKVLVVLHVGAALKHHFVDKDRVLVAMFNRYVVALSVLLFIAGAAWLTGFFDRSSQSPESVESDQKNIIVDALEKSSDLPLWEIDYPNSQLAFSAEQAGAGFDGEFGSWKADIQFDPSRLDESVIDVTINLDSVDTADEERDSTLLDDAFFAVERYPSARFLATSFYPLEGERNFRADALLNIKGVTAPVSFVFELVDSDEGMLLRGSSQLDRLALGIGTGDWLDTTWVGQYVDVQVEVLSR